MVSQNILNRWYQYLQKLHQPASLTSDYSLAPTRVRTHARAQHVHARTFTHAHTRAHTCTHARAHTRPRVLINTHVNLLAHVLMRASKIFPCYTLGIARQLAGPNLHAYFQLCDPENIIGVNYCLSWRFDGLDGLSVWTWMTRFVFNIHQRFVSLHCNSVWKP